MTRRLSLRRGAAALLALSLLAGASAGRAQEPAPSPAPEAEAPAAERPAPNGGILSLLPAPVRSRHSVTVGGTVIPYEAEAGTLSLLGGAGEVTAEIFYTAYWRDPPAGEGARDRPITFVFNGGPGAASAYLHIGALGPRILATEPDGGFAPPPARLRDNPDTWLDMTDLVFVDPVGTGYSREAPGKTIRDFLGVEQDAAAMGAFIRLFLQSHDRTGSPVFLAGESYGGFRAALLARTLQEDVGIRPSGIVMISPALEFSFVYGDEYQPLTYALTLPALAAANLERQGVSGEALRRGMAEAEAYALGPYLEALASGLESGRDRASGEVARLTGLPEEVVRRRFARLTPDVFAKERERGSGEVLSPYDGTLASPDIAPESAFPVGPDAVLDRSVPALTAAFVDYARDELGYRTDLSYRLLNREIGRDWDYGTTPSRQGYAGVLDDLQAGRALNPAMGVLVAHGYSDLITPYTVSAYLLRQLPTLAGAEPIRLSTYEGGHMMYFRDDSRAALKRDATALYAD